jgi:hypothetical protein
MKTKQICVTDKEHRAEILEYFRVHLHFHPFVYTPVDTNYDTTFDRRANWEGQVKEMHDLCRRLDES